MVLELDAEAKKKSSSKDSRGWKGHRQSWSEQYPAARREILRCAVLLLLRLRVWTWSFFELSSPLFERRETANCLSRGACGWPRRVAGVLSVCV